jgi:hypothetical protein
MGYKHGFNLIKKDKSVERRFYDRWIWMNTRCNNSNRRDYINYANRGITVCRRWREFINFRNDMWLSFITHNNNYGLRHTTLERIDNNKGYSPNNCRWATKKDQSRNTTKTLYVDYLGGRIKLIELAELLHKKYHTLHARYRRGTSMEKSFRSSPKSSTP